MYFPVVRSQVLTAASTYMTAFWDIAIVALMMEEVITSEKSVCLYRSTGALSQKAVIFTFQLHCLEIFTRSWLALKSMCCRLKSVSRIITQQTHICSYTIRNHFSMENVKHSM
jgi:hypothetical protein